MDIERIKLIVNSGVNSAIIEAEILRTIAEDPNAIPHIIYMISAERESKKELLSEFNLILSKAQVCLMDESVEKRTSMKDEIRIFYKKNKGKVVQVLTDDKPNP